MKISVPAVTGLMLLLFAACSAPKQAQIPDLSSLTTDTTKAESQEMPDNAVVVTPRVYHTSFPIVNDLVSTKLEVKFDWQKQYMYGKEWVTLKPHFYNTDSLLLDAKGMDIHTVALMTAQGPLPLAYTYDSSQLHIHLDRTYKKDEAYSIFIDYTAKPNELPQGGSAAISGDKGLYFINPDGKNPNEPRELWTQGETESNSAWFPTIDKPDVRTTIEISMTVEDGFLTLSNGVMVSSKENGDKTHTDVWKLDQTIPPYLVMMAAGPFALIKDKWKNIEVNYYVDQDYEKYAKAIFGRTPEMIQYFSDITGVPFVWPKYSQVAVHEYVSGAMENATAVVHGSFVQMTAREMIDGNQDDVISHELFHHWFGDLVTTESWSNITLNESFADYGEYLWNEHEYGKDEADYRFQHSMNAYLSQPDAATVPLVRYYYQDREDVFDAVSYNKGGRILHMLRNYVGDDAFFQSLHDYLTANEFHPAEVANLRLAFEKVTGKDLNWFFNQWYFSPGHPKINVSSEYHPESHTVAVTVEQTQDTSEGVPVFKLPVAIDVYVNGKVNRFHGTFEAQTQTLSLPCDSRPDLINFDADKMLLCTKNVSQSDTAYAFQFYHAPLFLDRSEAVTYFKKKNSSSPFYDEVITSALSDPFWNIRVQAIGGVKENSNEAMKGKVRSLAVMDNNSRVRAGALKQMTSWDDSGAVALAERALNDSSYLVISTALDVLAQLDSAKAMAAAAKLENEESNEIGASITQIYAKYAGPEKNELLLNKINTASGFGKYMMLQDYETYISRNAASDAVTDSALPVLEKIALSDSHWWLRFRAMNTLVAVQEALDKEKDSLMTKGDQSGRLQSVTQQASQLQEKISEIKSKEQDARLRSMYGLN